MSNIIPPNHKFCCIALSGVYNLNINLPCNIFPNISLHSSNPFELDEHWSKWLGSLEIDHLSNCSFIILSSALSKNPKDLDNEHESLRQKTYFTFYSILMQSLFPYDKGSILIGSRVKDKIEIRQVAKLDRIYCHDYAVPPRLNNKKIERAKRILVGLLKIYSNQNLYNRIRMGFDAWMKAIKERRGDFRLHQFVRSVEAIIKPERNKTKRNFIHRCKLLTSINEAHNIIFDEIYELRSLVEHMHDWKSLYVSLIDDEGEKVATLRTYQVEKLSGNIYSRIFSDAQLLKNFANDDKIDSFWKQKDHEIKAKWGLIINLDKISRSF